MERMGRHGAEHAFPAGAPGRPDCGRRAAPDAEVGVRFSGGDAGVGAAGDRVRAPLRRQPQRPRLFPRRQDRVHALDLHCPHGRTHRDQRGAAPGRLRRVFRRHGRDRVRGRREHGRAGVEPARRRAPGGADHRRTHAVRGPAVRAGVVAGRGVGADSRVRMLPVPREHRRVGCRHRRRDLEDVHAGRADADRSDADRRPRLGSVRGRDLERADDRRRARRALHRDRQPVHRPGPRDWRCGARPRHA